LSKTPSVQIFGIAQKLNCPNFRGCSPSPRLVRLWGRFIYASEYVVL